MLHKYNSYKNIKIIFNTKFISVFISKFFRYIMIFWELKIYAAASQDRPGAKQEPRRV